LNIRIVNIIALESFANIFVIHFALVNNKINYKIVWFAQNFLHITLTLSFETPQLKYACFL